jgi:small subunit ribosomal protein S6
MLIFDPDLGEERIGAILSKIEGKIKSLGGGVEKTDKWGVRRLASMVKRAKKLQQAYYVVLYFKSEPSLPEELQNYLKVTENIVRYSIVRAAPKPLAEIEGAPLKAEGGEEAVNVGEIKEQGESLGGS